jgi:hypothetical protein
MKEIKLYKSDGINSFRYNNSVLHFITSYYRNYSRWIDYNKIGIAISWYANK